MQHEGGIEKLVALNDTLPDSQARLRANAHLFIDALSELDEATLVRLVQFIATRCYLVTVATPDLDSAYRIFGVLNSRGLDLSATDILKAEIIGAIEGSRRDAYTTKWEDLEEDLGRDGFGDLFSHIRMVYRKAKPKGTLLKEFREHVGPPQPVAFIDEVLLPMAQAFREVTDADYASQKHAEAVNDALRWLNRIEFKDWMPPALAFFTRHRNDPDAVRRFVMDLERLAYSMLVRKAGVNERIERFSRLTAAVEADAALHAADSPLQLSAAEQYATYAALSGPLYETHSARALGVILLRLDALVSDGSKTMAHDLVTVEHVLPQQPRSDSGWVGWIASPQERSAWVHRLGNLALLNRKKNSAAGNYDFARKKDAYFSKGGTCAFPLTTQVLQQDEWTVPVLETRQAALLDVLERHLRLEGRKHPAPALAVGADEESPLLAIESPRHQLHARGRQADAQFLVYAGSTARAAWIGMDGGYKVLHQDLVDSGTLGAVRGEVREFKRDAVFSSPSAAAAVVWGRSANGRTSWVVKETGQSLAEWEQGIPAGQLEDDDDADGDREAFYRRFWDQFLERAKAHGDLFAGRTTSASPWLGTGLGRSGFRLNVSLTRELGRVTCMINQPEQGTEWFDVLHAQREAIEHDFGGPLMWDPLPEQKRSLIRTVVPGGWHLAEAEWPAFQDALIQLANRMDSVLRGRIRDIEK